MARAVLDRHQTWSWSYRCLVKHFIKLESFLPGFLVEEGIKDGIFLTWLALFLTFSGCCRGIGRKSPGIKNNEENNVSPSWCKKNTRSSLSNVESVQDVGVTPRKILGRGLQFSFVKKNTSLFVNKLRHLQPRVFVNLLINFASVLEFGKNVQNIQNAEDVQDAQDVQDVQDVQDACLTCSHSLVMVASPAET